MKNFVQPGNSIEVLAPTGGVVSGQAFIVGSHFGVASKDAADGDPVNMLTEGVVRVQKLGSDNMVVGEKVNFNDTTKNVQEATTDLDGVGTVTKDAASPAVLVEIKMTPV